MRKLPPGTVLPECMDCERPMARRSRQLCCRCWRAHDAAGTLDQFTAWASSVARYEDYLVLLRHGLTQRKIAARLGVHPRTISRYEAHRVGKEIMKSLIWEDIK